MEDEYAKAAEQLAKAGWPHVLARLDITSCAGNKALAEKYKVDLRASAPHMGLMWEGFMVDVYDSRHHAY